MGKLFAVVLLVFWAVQPTFAGSYLVFEDFGGTWHDADKTPADKEDGLMCWAAAAANVLTWGHWDTPDHCDEASIFVYFHDHWTNGTGSPALAWQWWLTGRPTGQFVTSRASGHGGNEDFSCDFGKWGSHLKESGSGGGYWTSYDFRKYFHEESDPSKAMTAIDAFLHKGYGVVVGIQRRGKSTGHVLTAWGCQTDDDGGFSGLFVTNSDDGVHKLDYLPVMWDSRGKQWKVPTLDGFIREVWALEPRPA